MVHLVHGVTISFFAKVMPFVQMQSIQMIDELEKGSSFSKELLTNTFKFEEIYSKKLMVTFLEHLLLRGMDTFLPS